MANAIEISKLGLTPQKRTNAKNLMGMAVAYLQTVSKQKKIAKQNAASILNSNIINDYVEVHNPSLPN